MAFELADLAVTSNAFDTNESEDEGEQLTVPKYKKYKNYKNKKPAKPYNYNNQDDMKLKQFIQKYKLQNLSEALQNEGITVDFLISQSNAQIAQIAKELTSKVIQQNKVK